MTDSEKLHSKTLARALEQVGRIGQAQSRERLLACNNMASGYFLALVFEGLITQAEYNELVGQVDQAFQAGLQRLSARAPGE